MRKEKGKAEPALPEIMQAVYRQQFKQDINRKRDIAESREEWEDEKV